MLTSRDLHKAPGERVGKSINQYEINTFLSLLKAKAGETAKALYNREASRSKSADEFGEIAIVLERDIAVQHLDRESQLLHQIWARYARIEDGTFGMCSHCEEKISQKSLAAVPWAPVCPAPSPEFALVDFSSKFAYLFGQSGQCRQPETLRRPDERL